MMLATWADEARLTTILDPAGLRRYPPATQRDAWQALPAETRAALVRAGEARLGQPWPGLRASQILDFVRTGNRTRYEQPFMHRRQVVVELALAECAEGRGRFIDELVDGLWLIMEETSWSLPAHLRRTPENAGLPDPDVPMLDLVAAETAALLAWVDHLLGAALDGLAPALRQRLRREVDRRALAPYLARDDFFWMGFHAASHRPNNWNPWINSNVLVAALLLEPDAGRRAEIVAKALRSLDHFLAPYPADGGCDEGPGYWGHAGASLFDCLDLMHAATGGACDAFADARIREIGRYIFRVQIAGDWFVNFADASARTTPPAVVTYRFGQRLGDADLAGFGAWLCRRGGAAARTAAGANLTRRLRALFDVPELDAAPVAEPLPEDVWLPQTELLVARDRGGATGGWFLAAKGGDNNESHNHNDIGAFIVFRDGCPLLVDAGVGEYRRQTFSPERYTIWTMQSAFHNLLPTVDGVMQMAGAQYRSRNVAWNRAGASSTLQLDLAGAYPEATGVAAWEREIVLERGTGVTVRDRYRLTRPVVRIELALLTPSQVAIEADGSVILTAAPLPDGHHSATGRLQTEIPAAQVRVETVNTGGDSRLSLVWGARLHRIVWTLPRPPREATLVWRILT